MESLMDIRESLMLAEQMAQLSLFHPEKGFDPSVQSHTKAFAPQDTDDASKDTKPYVPPKQLLLYLSRMGSFTSRKKIEAMDQSEDESAEIPSGLEYGDFLLWVQKRKADPDSCPLPRGYRSAPGRGAAVQDSTPFRVLQWNVLAQALGTQADNFVRCPPKALEWETRKYSIVEEILSHDPDIICLQEVDHFRYLQRMLDTQGFTGFFVPKPDSPCIYLDDNNGPDGCALFYRRDRFQLVSFNSRVLEVWKIQSNQVAILVTLQDIKTRQEVLVLTTHLKARKGALLASFRNEQGRDILSYLEPHRSNKPVIVCGDFNAEPTEPVYSRLTHPETGLSSSYAETHDGEEPAYSTWKIRGDGEAKHNLDYIFYTSKHLQLEGCIDAPTEEHVGADRVPSLQYPSDHFSLISDFSFKRDASRFEPQLKSRQ